MDKLKHRDCSEALEWCNTHKTKLQKSNVSVITHTIHIIELIGVQAESLGIY